MFLQYWYTYYRGNESPCLLWVDIPWISCCRMFWKSGKRASSKLATAVTFVLQTILKKINLLYITNYQLNYVFAFLSNLHVTDLIDSTIVSKRKWLKCGLLGFLATRANLSVNLGNRSARNGTTRSWSVENVRIIAFIMYSFSWEPGWSSREKRPVRSSVARGARSPLLTLFNKRFCQLFKLDCRLCFTSFKNSLINSFK